MLLSENFCFWVKIPQVDLSKIFLSNDSATMSNFSVSESQKY